MAGKSSAPDPPEPEQLEDSDIPDKEDEAQEEDSPPTRPEGEDPWEEPCQVCGLLGCRRHT